MKAPGARECGYDARRKVSGRKQHIAVDSLVKRWPWVKPLLGDAAYDRRTSLDKSASLDFTFEIFQGLQGQTGFQVQPQRWAVERTFAWLMCYWRLVQAY